MPTYDEVTASYGIDGVVPEQYGNNDEIIAEQPGNPYISSVTQFLGRDQFEEDSFQLTPVSDAYDAKGSDWSPSKLWSEFKDLKSGTQSVIASALFAGISSAFKHDYKKDEVDLLKQKMDLEKTKDARAANSTAESYDKTKYQIPAAFKPVGLINTPRSAA